MKKLRAKGFLGWAKEQTGSYNYADIVGCPIARYLHTLGYLNVYVGNVHWTETDGRRAVHGFTPAMSRVSETLSRYQTYEEFNA